jgi:ubiquinone/menaquinone biosynthesis C-methylase UbiE
MDRDPEGVETRRLHAYARLRGRRALEIGCGEGRLTWRYAAVTRRVVGVDPDPARLAVAPHDCPPALRDRVGFVRATAGALPFRAARFDRVILAWSL